MDYAELFREIRKIEIVTRSLVNDQLAGQYHSVFKGRGMAFDEVRQYQRGDDVRLIDWNVSARMNEPYVKVFVEEREMTVMLLVDVSASGTFGTTRQTKARLAAKLAAIFAFSAIRNNDRVGLILFSDRVERFVPPKKGKKHVLRVVSEILQWKPAGRGTDIACALDFLGRVAKRKSVAVVCPTSSTMPLKHPCGCRRGATTSFPSASATREKSRCRRWAWWRWRTLRPGRCLR